MNVKLYGIIAAVVVTGTIGLMYTIPSTEAQQIPWPSDQPYDNFVKCLSSVEYIHRGTLYAIELYQKSDTWDTDNLSEQNKDAVALGLRPTTDNTLTALTANIIAENVRNTEIEQCILIFRADMLEAEQKLRQQLE